MNSIFKQQLEKLINLNNIKIIDKPNKKIVCTSLFLPEIPSINIKTSVYILGLIKTIETFSKNMGNNWILRVYYDSMFDNGIKLKKLDKTTEQLIKIRSVIPETSYALVAASQHNIKKGIEFKKSITQKKLYSNATKSDATTSTSPFEYQYNSVMVTNNDTDPKNEIVKNKEFLKKIIKLVHLYFKHISSSTEEQYDNIELVSYDCQKASNNPDIIGHPSTFGSIMRFLPLYDDDVDTFFCINSEYQSIMFKKL